MLDDLTLRCEVCLRDLTPDEERDHWRAYDAAPAHEAPLLAVACERCRERDRAVQQRMHAALVEWGRERGR